MSELKTYKFSDLYEMSSGISSKPDQAGHGDPFLSFSTVFNNVFLPDELPDLMDTPKREKEVYSINEGDVFLTRTSETLDELGMSCVAVKDYPNASYSGFLKRLRPTQSDITYPKFMAFYLRSKLFRKTMTNNAIMTLRASLNEQIFSYLELILPPFEVQKKIGDFLYKTILKERLNNKINSELEAMAKLIYDYWFVQFDFPDKNGNPYKSSGGQMVYNKELKREIPEGWKVKELSEITAVSNDSLNPMDLPKKNYKHYSIPTYDKKGTYGIEKGEEIRSNKFTITENDLLVSKLNPWFNRIIYPVLEDDLISSTEFVVWRTSNNKLKNFLFQLAKGDHFVAHCVQSASGTSNSHKRVNPRVMMRYPLPFKQSHVERFGELVNSWIQMIIKNQKENQQLSSLRDWLLPMLMNGQVTVGEAEEYVQSSDLSMVAEKGGEYDS